MQNLNDHIEEVQQKISYWFNNLDLLFQAFTRSSYSTQYGGENNEVLEFLGDRVLDYYVVKVMADRYGYTKSQLNYYNPDKDDDEFCIKAHRNEQSFTELKKEIVSNATLAKLIDKLGFAKYMFLGDSDIDNKVWKNEKAKADLFEAILGAIAIDCDWNPDELQNSVEFMLNIEDFLADVQDGEERPEDCSLENAVNTLKELAEHGRCSIPEYDQPDEEIQGNGNLKWMCSVYVRSWGIRKTAYATSKKLAKKYAAYLVLCDVFALPNEYEGDEADGD